MLNSLKSKLGKRGTDAKRGRINDQVQPKFKMRAPNQDVSRAPKDNY